MIVMNIALKQTPQIIKEGMSKASHFSLTALTIIKETNGKLIAEVMKKGRNFLPLMNMP